MTFYAHTKTQKDESTPAPESEWEPVFTRFGDGRDECQRESCEKCRHLDPMHGHLNKVAFWSGKFAEKMFPSGSDDAESAFKWGYLAGLWHDLGKFSKDFQERLRGIRERADHSTAGAQHSFALLEAAGQLFAYVIAGHHAGLADWNGNASDGDLYQRLRNNAIPAWKLNAPEELLECPELPKLSFLSPNRVKEISFFVRFLFSCLVDADFLATEAFMNANRWKRRPQWPKDILARMEGAVQNHCRSLSFGERSEVNQCRNSVLSDCIEAAGKTPGLFTLTVPTGGGKTISSLAFALRHAREYNLRRIIYVIPYTSIIEQNAGVFRNIFQNIIHDLPDDLASSLVLEHHSNYESDNDSIDEKPVWKLTAENWDAPLVVTTNVQFFESLYSNRSSGCRKLHNMARSVVILDEAQNLPVPLLSPCLDTLKHVTRLTGSSVVLCTATQPAISRRPDSGDAFNRIALNLGNDREIVRDVPALFSSLKRVQIQRETAPLSDEALVAHLKQHERVLCILNTKPHATRIFELIDDEDSANIHLSAQLCPVHRQAVLSEVRKREKNSEPCRLIATTVVEAGVDIDFPVVYRSLTGLDSLAQAAGRCNRHGKLTETKRGNLLPGMTILFTPADRKTPGFLASDVNATQQVIDDYDDLLSPPAIEHYFRVHYWKSGGHNGRDWDKKEILSCFDFDGDEPEHPFAFQFKTAAEKFRLIEDTQAPVIIDPAPGLWNGQDENQSAEIRDLLVEIRRSDEKKSPPPAGAQRRLQRYTVQVPKAVHTELIRTGVIQLYHHRFPILTHPENDYDPKLGLVTSRQQSNAAAFMV